MSKESYILTTYLVCISFLSFSQNLVPNGSFENYITLPDKTILNISEYVENWNKPTWGSPDYFHKLSDGPNSVPYQLLMSYTDTSYQEAKDGYGFVGFSVGGVTELRGVEYLQSRLMKGLVRNHKYKLKASLNLSDLSKYKGYEIGFRITKVRDSSNYSWWPEDGISPFDTDISNHYKFEESLNINSDTWTDLVYLLKAKGNESWLTIGCFSYDSIFPKLNNDSSNYIQGLQPGAYYFIDDVSLVEISTLVGPDTVCAGENIELYSSFYGENCRWYNDTNRLNVLSTDTFLRVTADHSRWYYLETSGGRDSLYLNVLPVPQPTLHSDTFYCEGESIKLSIIDSSANASISIFWSDYDSVFNKVISDKGTVSYTVSNGFCDVSHSIIIEERKNPSEIIPDQFTFCKVESNFMTIDLDHNYKYTWSDIGQKNNERNFYDEGTYSFYSESEYGCKTTDSLVVVDLCEPIIHVPNVFVVGGINNTFSPYLQYTNGGTLDIFNRWGEKIYSVTAEYPSWDGSIDGKVQQQGVFMYQLSVSTKRGTTLRKGTVTLLHK